MRVQLNGKTLVVGWAYAEEAIEQPEQQVAVDDAEVVADEKEPVRMRKVGTICKISMVNPDNTLTELSRGETKCSKKDLFKRETGRKNSLQRALAKKNAVGAMFPLQERFTIWQQYFISRGKELPLELQIHEGDIQI